MKKYQLTSKGFEGAVVFGYRDGWLVYYENETDMDLKGLQWISRHFPVEESHLGWLQDQVKSGVIKQVPMDLSFDVFWEAYGKKINKKRCEPLWAKLKDSDRLACIESIKPYEGFLRRHTGRAKKDPENYLKDRMWENNWRGL